VDAIGFLVFFVFGNLVEYWLHRTPLHRRIPGLKNIFEIHSNQHHRFFSQHMPFYESTRDLHTVFFPAYAPVALILGLILAGKLFPHSWSPNAAPLLVVASCSYFLMYELLHFSHHTGILKFEAGSLLGKMRAHHTLHHDPTIMTKTNFNVTFPLCDWLFGTFSKG